MMSDLKQLQYELGEMQVTVRELSVLEDYNGADYSDVISEVRWNHMMLKHRLDTLRRRMNDV